MLEYIRELLTDQGLEDALLFDNPDYDSAIIGVSHDDRVIYDYDLIVEELVKRDGMTVLEAYEFIDYNVIRSIPYAGEKAPIVMHPIEVFE